MTNKKDAAKQIGKRVRRMEMAEQALHRRKLRERRHALYRAPSESMDANTTDDAADDSDLRYFISPSQNQKIDIYQLLRTRNGDPAYKVSVKKFPYTSVQLVPIKAFLPKLQDHLLGRLLGRDFDGDTYGPFTPNDRQTLKILSGKMYSVQTCRLYYTTYDVQRQTDTVNPRTCADVMVHASAPDDEDDAGDHEPYWYARVLGIYHAKVSTSHSDAINGREVRRMEFLWVRWLGAEPGHRHGFPRAVLPKIGFVPSTDEYAFGFLDPKHVIRGCHLIPAFTCGRTSDLLPVENTDARLQCYGRARETDDWMNFYVNM